jgi:hypothetical protein
MCLIFMFISIIALFDKNKKWNNSSLIMVTG